MTTLRHQYTIVGFVDDNPQKHGAFFMGKRFSVRSNDIPNLNIIMMKYLLPLHLQLEIRCGVL